MAGKVLGLIPKLTEVTGEKLGWGLFAPPSLNRINADNYIQLIEFITSFYESESNC